MYASDGRSNYISSKVINTVIGSVEVCHEAGPRPGIAWLMERPQSPGDPGAQSDVTSSGLAWKGWSHATGVQGAGVGGR